MTIKSSGIISISDINIELAFNSAAQKSLNDGDVRTLLGKSSGIISLSDAYGKTKVTSGGTLKASALVTTSETYYGWGGGPLWTSLYPGFGTPQGSEITGASGKLLSAIYWYYPADAAFGILAAYCRSANATLNIKINGISYSLPIAGLNYFSTADVIQNCPFVVGQSFTVDF